MYIPKIGETVELVFNEKSGFGNHTYDGIHISIKKIIYEEDENFRVSSVIVKETTMGFNGSRVGRAEDVSCGPDKWLLKSLVKEWDD